MTSNPSIRILRVSTIKSTPRRDSLVIAVIDEQHLVKLNTRDGWTCDCDTDAETCDHVDLIAAMMDPRVTACLEQVTA